MHSRLGFYATTSHAISESVLRDRRFGVVASGAFACVDWARTAEDHRTLAHPVEHSLLAMDPPAHTRLRKLATPAFAPRRLRARIPSIERVVRGFLDDMARKDTAHGPDVDLIAYFAVRVPVRVICDLLGAGFKTTVNLIGNGALALLANPDAKAELVERPEFAAAVVEEVLRFDPHRPNSRDHLAFSSGVHYCLGANLARIEGEIALRELFARFPELRIAGRPRRRPLRTLRGMERLPVATGRARTPVAG